MKEKYYLKFTLFFIISICIFTSCSILDGVIRKQESSIFSLKRQIVSLKFEVKKINKNTMYINYEFYNLAGQKLQSKGSAKIRGSELFIDCRVEQLNKNDSLVFPYAFYSNLVPANQGIVIVYDYNDNDYPEIFTGVSSSEKRKIKRLYANILQDTPSENSFRSSPHIVINKKLLKYKLVSRIRGGIEILKDSE